MSKNINFIDLRTKKTFSFDGKTFSESKIKNKKTPIAARLSYTDITSHSFQVKSNLSASELEVEIELKMHEEAGLNPEREYKILHINKNAPFKDASLLEVFMIDIEQIKQKYKDAIKIVKHIDFLTIPFLTFETLYQNKVLTRKNDLFICISIDEAFVTFYKEGTYLSSKKIESINDMTKYLNDRGVKIQSHELEDILMTKGLDKDKYEPHEYNIYEYLQNVFAKLFVKIDSLATHNRSIFSYTEINRVFFGVNNKQIPNIKSVVQNFTRGSEFYDLSFSSDKNINALDIVSSFYANDKLKEKNNDRNLSIFERKQSFFKGEIGKLSFATIAAFILMSIYPIYEQQNIQAYQDKTETLQEKLKVASQKTKTLQSQSKKIKDEIASLNEKKQDTDQKLNQMQDIVDTLIRLKSYDKKYISMFLTINKLLNKYNLGINKIEQAGKNKMSIELYSIGDRRNTIAKFMNDLLNKNFTSVTSGEIQLSDTGYKSIIVVQK